MRRKALKNTCCELVFSTAYNESSWDIFHIKNNQLIILYLFCRLQTLSISNSPEFCGLVKS